MSRKTNIQASLIAPCGMNCALCHAYQRDKNTCGGCNSKSVKDSTHIARCIIRNCDIIVQSETKLCCECSKLPCLRLRKLDKRYREKYNMSMIDKLMQIKSISMDSFVQKEIDRWACPSCGGDLCVHKGYCIKCKDKI